MHPRVDDLLLDDDIGLGEHGLGGRRVAGLPVETVIVLLAVEVGADHRGIGIERLARVDHRIERIVFDVDELQCIPCGIAVVCDHEGHLLALEADLVGG